MKTLSIVIGALLACSGVASAQLISNAFQHYGYVGDEPNVATAGTLPYANHVADNNGAYGADVNNIGTALAGTPAVILGANFYTGFSDVLLNSNKMLEPLTGRDFILPGAPGAFFAFHGTWADANEDGFITDPAYNGGSTYVNLAGRDCGNHQVRTDDPAGTGGTPVSYKCEGVDEWEGKTGATLVGYITPNVPTQTYVGNTIGDVQTREPDFKMRDLGGGEYVGPDSLFSYVFIDNSLLETTAVEIISTPSLTSEGHRSHVFGANSLQDTDIYQSVDPTVEAIYQTTVIATLVDLGIDHDHPESILFYSPDPSPDDVVDPVVGPPQAPFVQYRVNEDHGKDYAVAPHVYFDVYLQYSTYRGYVAGGSDGTVVTGDLSHTGDGVAHAPIYAGVYGRLGAWHDVSGDGWIGDANPSPGCPNEYDCGDDYDPNRYDTGNPDVAAEWTPACRDSPFGRINATLTSSTGSWGPAGVYVFTDRNAAGDRSSFAFNPWDDAVADATDGSVDQLVFSGPIELVIQCSGTFGIGRYLSYEHFVFPTSNLDFDVIVSTETFTVDLRSAGVEVPESVSDTDTYAGWTLS